MAYPYDAECRLKTASARIRHEGLHGARCGSNQHQGAWQVDVCTGGGGFGYLLPALLRLIPLASVITASGVVEAHAGLKWAARRGAEDVVDSINAFTFPLHNPNTRKEAAGWLRFLP